eukprot:1214-Prymnesium_polylepis.1
MPAIEASAGLGPRQRRSRRRARRVVFESLRRPREARPATRGRYESSPFVLHAKGMLAVIASRTRDFLGDRGLSGAQRASS